MALVCNLEAIVHAQDVNQFRQVDICTNLRHKPLHMLSTVTIISSQ